ncbi:DUF2637 domain-containing protein [Nocardia sp. NPDC051570]|uniref:DUF2637 domain-containing protein n=1 Tax=Nocardia sp. NPDC051570 TaxID=3364324 RepID=UPI00378CEDAA
MLIRERWMLVARVFAVLVIVGVGAAAFRLSFATLRDLAVLAHIPVSDAWLFPLIVDGTILQATAGVLVLANTAKARRWFTWVLVAGAVVSVAGNSLHAITGGHELPGPLCALVAAIAPIGLLVDTHGLVMLFRLARVESTPAVEPAPESILISESSVPEPDSTTPAFSRPVPSSPVAHPNPALVQPVRPRVRPIHPPRPAQQQALPLAVS